MRVERIRVDAFGGLRGLDSGRDSLGELVVVLGPNEAGKSTLFHYLTTMLYGFHPASREGNPYTPWTGEDAKGSVRLKLDQGDCVEVERRLLAQPTGHLSIGGRAEELRNRALPWAEHVPRQVFLQVFAITLSELAGLEEKTWGHIQDRVLGAMGASELESARVLAAALEEESGTLWRPNKRGNQKIRALQDRIRELQERRVEALKRDASLRSQVRTLGLERARLEEARSERHRARAVLERLEMLAPVRLRLRRVEALRAEAGDPDELADLPPDPRTALADLVAQARELRTREADLDEARPEPAAAVAAFDDAARTLVGHADAVNAFVALAGATAPERARLADLDQEVRDLQRRLDAAAAQVFAVPFDEVPHGPLLALPTGELAGAVSALKDAREERRVLEAAEERALRRASGGVVPPPILVAAAVGAGLIMLAAGAVLGSATLAGAGGALAALGAAELVRRRRAAGPAPAEAPGLGAARAAEDTALGEVRRILQDLPVLRSLLDRPDHDLVGALARLQELVRDRAERLRGRPELELRLERVAAEAHAMARLLGRTESDPWALARVLDRELRRAESLGQAASSAERELSRIQRERDRLDERTARLEGRRTALEDRLLPLGDGVVERGLEVAEARLRARERARQLEDELERAVPDLEDVRRRIADAERAGESWTRDDEDLARRRAGIETLTEEIEALVSRTEALERDLVHMQEGETVDAVDSAILTLEEEVTRLIFLRDRRWILARLVRQADRRFREEHQPDLMRRAGDHLRHLTGGRYDRILADDADGGGDLFLLGGPTLPEPVPLAPPLSTGTLEQAYFALRLAIVDHLDQGQERLPLFVDEALVNWDRDRRDRGIGVLQALSRARQLFVFTCHDEVARTLADRGGSLLELGPPR